jgi:hypothetical protein
MLSTMILLGLLAVSAAHAQWSQPMQFKIPFAFSVQNTGDDSRQLRGEIWRPHSCSRPFHPRLEPGLGERVRQPSARVQSISFKYSS